jgi:hypothetical protein
MMARQGGAAPGGAPGGGGAMTPEEQEEQENQKRWVVWMGSVTRYLLDSLGLHNSKGVSESGVGGCGLSRSCCMAQTLPHSLATTPPKHKQGRRGAAAVDAGGGADARGAPET